MGIEEVVGRQMVGYDIDEDNKCYRAVSIAERPIRTCQRIKNIGLDPGFHIFGPTREKKI